MTHKITNVDKCPGCNSGEIQETFVDYNKILYATCQNCSNWYIKEKPIKDYNDGYWGVITDPDGNVRDLTKERDFKIKNWYGDSVSYVNSQPPGRILDIGAGLGFFLSAVNNRWEKHAMEVSKTGVEFIHQNYPEVSVKNVYLENDTYPENYFDVVMFYHVIEHVPNPNEVLTHIKKILKPGGTIICGTPNIGSWVAKRFKQNYRLLGDAHICLFNPESLENIFKDHNFKVFEKEYPYWRTDYATFGNLMRLVNTSKLSPPFIGSVMTFYGRNQK